MSSIPMIIEYLPDCAPPIYEKVESSAAYVVDEEGENILRIQKPRKVFLPIFEVSSNPVDSGCTSAEEFAEKSVGIATAQIALTLRERMLALKQVADSAESKVNQFILPVRTSIVCLLAPDKETGKDGYSIFANLGIALFQAEFTKGEVVDPWTTSEEFQEKCPVGLTPDQRAEWVERKVASLLGLIPNRDLPGEENELDQLQAENNRLKALTPRLCSLKEHMSNLTLPTEDQPAPLPTDEQPVWEMVIEDMKARDHLGRERYGQPLQVSNGRDAYRDHYEELLDAVVYGKQVMIQRDKLLAENEALKAQVEGLSAQLMIAKNEHAHSAAREDWLLRSGGKPY